MKSVIDWLDCTDTSREGNSNFRWRQFLCYSIYVGKGAIPERNKKTKLNGNFASTLIERGPKCAPFSAILSHVVTLFFRSPFRAMLRTIIISDDGGKIILVPRPVISKRLLPTIYM